MNHLKRFLAILYRKTHNLFSSRGWLKAEVLFMVAGLFLSVLALMGFIAIADEVMEKEIAAFDRRVAQWVYQFRTEGRSRLMLLITELGARTAYIPLILLVAGLLYYNGRKWLTILEACLVLLLTTGLNRLLKFSFLRPRPTGFQLVPEHSWSFPSGHSMTAMAFYGFLVLLVWRYSHKPWLRWSATIVLSFAVLLVGLSRVYLGVHYPSDVLAGYAAGLFWLTLSGSIFQWLRNRRRKLS